MFLHTVSCSAQPLEANRVYVSEQLSNTGLNWFIRDFAVDPAGNSYLVGRYVNQLSIKGLTLQGDADMRAFIVKLDKFGNPIKAVDGTGPSGKSNSVQPVFSHVLFTAKSNLIL